MKPNLASTTQEQKLTTLKAMPTSPRLFLKTTRLIGQLKELHRIRTFFYADATPDWKVLEHFSRCSDLFIYCASGATAKRFCDRLAAGAGDQFRPGKSVPTELRGVPGFRVLSGEAAPDWAVFAICGPENGRLVALLAVGCESAPFYKAFFGDLETAPAVLCLGDPDAGSGDLGVVVDADERLKPGLIITRSRDRRWPWKLR